MNGYNFHEIRRHRLLFGSVSDGSRCKAQDAHEVHFPSFHGLLVTHRSKDEPKVHSFASTKQIGCWILSFRASSPVNPEATMSACSTEVQ